MNQNPLIGAWRLTSFVFKDNNGNIVFSFDKDAIGYIMYTADGHVSVSFMTTTKRPKFVSEDEDIFGGTMEEKAAAAETYISYCGKYKIKENKVFHNVELSLFPNEVGTVLERFFKLEDNKLSITTVPFVWKGKEQITAYANWIRSETR